MKSPSAYRFCGKKRAYLNEQIALEAGRFAALRAYRCFKCHKWHLTRNPKINPDPATKALFK